MEEALRASLAEKDILLRELSHRTKNNMQVIVGLLDLQAAKSRDAKLVERAGEAPRTGSGPWRWCTRSSTGPAASPP